MRKISANHILPVSSPPLKNGIITLDNDGSVLELIDTGGKLHEEAGLEFYQGTIIPGFALPWLRFNEIMDLPDPDNSGSPEDNLDKLNLELIRNGIKGVGLVLRDSMLSDGGFKRMRDSSLIYHPVIELCPGLDEDDFEAFNRGIGLVSRAWNEFNLSCSLSICSPANDAGDLGRYFRKYTSSHRNAKAPGYDKQVLWSPGKAPLNILKKIQSLHPGKSLNEILPEYTLQAAAEIFVDDVLGSIEPAKKPGLNLVFGNNAAIKVLV